MHDDLTMAKAILQKKSEGEMGRQHQRMNRKGGGLRFHEGSGRQSEVTRHYATWWPVYRQGTDGMFTVTMTVTREAGQLEQYNEL